jgi:ribosomal protein S18 acetylase RimI-like enzyme
MIFTPIRSPHEVAVLMSLDTSFSTTQIYRVVGDDSGFTLRKESVAPIYKSFPLSNLSADILPTDYIIAAEKAGDVAGFASMRFEPWNRRSTLRHLYVAPEYRRTGVGRAVVNAISAFAEAVQSRCLWVEAQNTNYPAIQFYIRVGFQLCGLDTSLYDCSNQPIQEIGLFFAKFTGTQSSHAIQRTAGGYHIHEQS